MDTPAARAPRRWIPRRVLVTASAAERPHGRGVIERCEAAGVDDITAESSGVAGHRADLEGALPGDADLPVLLVAHQPKYVPRAAAAGVDLHLTGQDDLLQRAGADALDGARDGRLVVLGRHRPDDAVAPSGIGVQQRERRDPQLGQARLEAVEQALGVVPGARGGHSEGSGDGASGAGASGAAWVSRTSMTKTRSAFAGMVGGLPCSP